MDSAAQIAELQKNCKKFRDEAVALRTEPAVLRHALKKYGQHTRSPILCSQANFYEDERGPCTCGLDAALAYSPARNCQ